jgi:hypothetical protein
VHAGRVAALARRTLIRRWRPPPQPRCDDQAEDVAVAGLGGRHGAGVPPAAHHHHPLGDREHVLEVDQDHGDALRTQAADQGQRVARLLRPERQIDAAAGDDDRDRHADDHVQRCILKNDHQVADPEEFGSTSAMTGHSSMITTKGPRTLM